MIVWGLVLLFCDIDYLLNQRYLKHEKYAGRRATSALQKQLFHVLYVLLSLVKGWDFIFVNLLNNRFKL